MYVCMYVLLHTECGLSVGLCVCLLVTFVSFAKKAEPIEMPFGRLTLVCPRKHVLDERQVGRIHSQP